MQYKISDFNNRQVLPELRVSGVYKIETIDGRVYIGSTLQTFRKRWSSHYYCLKRNKHHSKYLQNIYNKHGLDYISFSIIEEVSNNKDILIEREQYWIDTLKPVLNMVKTAYSVLGHRHTDETRNIMREAKRKITKDTNGIHYLKVTNKFRVMINVDNEKLVLGNYEVYDDAIKARKEGVDYFWAEAFSSKSKEERIYILEQFRKDNDGHFKKGTNIGLNYIRRNKNCNTFRFDYYPTKHTKYFKTVEEAIKYKEEYFASGCTLKYIKSPPKSGYHYITNTKAKTYIFKHKPTKHAVTFKTLEEAIIYRDSYLLEFKK